jgi:hypothetical protein
VDIDKDLMAQQSLKGVVDTDIKLNGGLGSIRIV